MTWKNPRWNSLKGPDADALRQIFESLSIWLAAPVFNDGITVGNGGTPTYDPVSDTVSPPDSTPVDLDRVDAIEGELADVEVRVDAAEADIDALDTRLTDIEGDVAALASVGPYTPTDSNVTVGNGTQVARYTVIGGLCWFEWSLVFGTTTSVGTAGNVTVGLPLPRSGAGRTVVGVHVENAGTRVYTGSARIVGTDQYAAVAHSESLNSGNVDDVSPFTFGVGDALIVSGFYPVG